MEKGRACWCKEHDVCEDSGQFCVVNIWGGMWETDRS